MMVLVVNGLGYASNSICMSIQPSTLSRIEIPSLPWTVEVLPQISVEAHAQDHIEDSSLVKGPSPLPCQFGRVVHAGAAVCCRKVLQNEAFGFPPANLMPISSKGERQRERERERERGCNRRGWQKPQTGGVFEFIGD